MLDNNKGQVWIETVIYILIGLALIALVLSFVLPRVNEQKDKVIIEQTILSLNTIDLKMNEVIDSVEGNKRIVDFNMRVGELDFDTTDNEKIVFTLTGLEKPYSEPGLEIPIGRVRAKTEVNGRISVTLFLEYEDVADLSFDGRHESVKFNPSVSPYKFTFENIGSNNIDIREIS
jgi:type II secretory pathway pseudopilin PulG